MNDNNKTNPIQIEIHDPEAEQLEEALGISRERKDELKKLNLEAALECKGKVSEILRITSSKCRNANELAMCCFVVGRAVADHETQNQIKELLNQRK